MPRLTNDLKECIIDAAIKKAGLSEKYLALGERRNAWAEAVRLDAIGGADIDKKVERIRKRFERACGELPEAVRPDKVFPMRASIYVRIGSSGYRIYFFKSAAEDDNETERRLSPDDHRIAPGSSLGKQWAKLNSDRNALDQETADLRYSLHCILDGCRTVEKLREIWPESPELLDAIAPQFDPTTLNKKLKLKAK